MVLPFRQIIVMTLALGFLSSCGTSNSNTETLKQTIHPTINTPPYGAWFWRDTSYSSQRHISVSRKGNVWRATVDGKTFSAEAEGDGFKFSLANGERFIGRRSNNNLLTGTWYQPEAKYAYSSMATQVSLSTVSENQWSGVVSVQPRPFHLFLDIFEDEKGDAKAVIRNPERNDVLGASLFEVIYAKKGFKERNWQLQANRRGSQISIPLLISDDSTLQLEHPQIEGKVSFRRANNDDLSKYYSRVQNELTSKRSAIEILDDGWQVSEASQAGFDVEVLDNLINKIALTDPRARSPQLLHSLLVSYKSQLVMEEYFYGHEKDMVHDTRSLAKVFGSAMIGAAQQNGYNISHSYAPLPKIFQEHGVQIPANKSSLTLESFLTHTSGLDTSEDSRSAGSEDQLWSQRKKDFWLYTAQLPVLHPPGKRYAYSSASANMIGAALEQITNVPVREFFHETLAKPLQFSTYHWNLTPNDKSYLGGGVYMRPRDILKIGALYAAKGKWRGKQIVPEAWVSLSTTSKIEINAQSTGLSEEEFSNNYFGGGQAYIWLVDDIVVGSKTYNSYTASGNGGQLLIVVPELELAVGFTGGNYRMGSVWGRWRQQIVGDFIIPSLQEETLATK